MDRFRSPTPPQPFPYVWNNPVAQPQTQGGPSRSFAYSSSQQPGGGTVRKRSSTPSSAGSASGSDSESEGELSDPYDLDKYVKEAEKKRGGVKEAEEKRGGNANSMDEDDEKRVEQTNVGMRLLMRLGWSEGTGLGKDKQGRLKPIDPTSNLGSMGLGGLAMETRLASNATQSSKTLESQRFALESEDAKAVRMERAAMKNAVKAEIAATLQKFHCNICDKAYSNVSQYDEHTNSYDHHHRARALALKQQEREAARNSGEVDRRREKERKREEKELAKRMGVAGIKMGKSVAVGLKEDVDGAPVKAEEEVKEKKKGGWAKVGDAKSTTGGFKPAFGGGGFKAAFGAAESGEEKKEVETPPESSAGGFKKGGWASVGPSPSTSTSAAATTPPPVDPDAYVPRTLGRAAPAFRKAGILEPTLPQLDDIPKPKVDVDGEKGKGVDGESYGREGRSGWNNVPPPPPAGPRGQSYGDYDRPPSGPSRGYGSGYGDRAPPPSNYYDRPPPALNNYDRPSPPSINDDRPPPPSVNYNRPPDTGNYYGRPANNYGRPPLPPNSNDFNRPPLPPSPYDRPPLPPAPYDQPPPPPSGNYPPPPPNYDRPPPPGRFEHRGGWNGRGRY